MPSLPCSQANDCLTGHEWVVFTGDSQPTLRSSHSCARFAARMQNQPWLPTEPPTQAPPTPPTSAPVLPSSRGGSSLPPPPPPPWPAATGGPGSTGPPTTDPPATRP